MATEMKYTYGKTACEVTDAANVRGFLINTADGYYFRVYDNSGDFIDYQLLHDDLEVTINSSALASFYRNDDIAVLDHSPAVLGLNPVVNKA
jgi:hypothetical protein